MVLTVSGDPSAGDDQIVACRDLHQRPAARQPKDATVTGSYSSWQQKPFNGRKVDLPRLGEYGNDLAKLVS